MDALLGHIYAILTVPPGNLAYHLVLAFSIAGALQGALLTTGRQNDPLRRRLGFGLSLLLILQFGLFTAAGLAWQGALDAHAALPPLDRGVSALSSLVLVWLWAFPTAKRVRDNIFGGLGAVTIIFMVVSLAVWPSFGPDTPFNATWLEWAWQAACAGIALAGVALLGIRMPPLWGPGFGALLILFFGSLVQMLSPEAQSDYPGAVRLAQLAAYPLLLSLPQRAAPPVPRPKPLATILQSAGQSQANLDLPTLTSLLTLAVEGRTEITPAALARAVSHAVHADRCYLLAPIQKSRPILLRGGYDRQSDLTLPVLSLDGKLLAPLSAAQNENRSLTVDPASPTMAELDGFARAIDLPALGHLHYSPIFTAEGQPLGGLLLLSPYSGRAWTPDDDEYLVPVSAFLGAILDRPGEPAPVREIEKVSSETHSAWTPEDAPSATPAAVTTARSDRPSVSNHRAETELAALLAAQAELNDAVIHLQEENERLKTETTRLSEIETQLKTSEADHQEQVSFMLQELPQPANAILGFADLLLGESMGSVGPLQRKFLERIQGSAKKLLALLLEVERFGPPNGPGGSRAPVESSAAALIDRALDFIEAERAEKEIAIEKLLPPQDLRFTIDQDAANQVLTHLLQYACAVTPVGGTVQVSAEVQPEGAEGGRLIVRVTDAGEGIAPDDLAATFAPQAHFGEGIAGSAASLSVAKSLVDSLGGQIWVDTVAPGPATICASLPIQPSRGQADEPAAQA